MTNFSVDQRIKKLREYLKILDELRGKYSKKQFISQYTIYGLAERFLHLAIEAVIDIGNQIIIQLDLPKPDYYRDVIRALAQAKVLPKPFSRKFEGIAEFRNVLAHDYLKIDHAKVYDHLMSDYSQIKTFLRHVVKFLER